jgi:hypothetical protein
MQQAAQLPPEVREMIGSYRSNASLYHGCAVVMSLTDGSGARRWFVSDASVREVALLAEQPPPCSQRVHVQHIARQLARLLSKLAPVAGTVQFLPPDIPNDFLNPPRVRGVDGEVLHVMFERGRDHENPRVPLRHTLTLRLLAGNGDSQMTYTVQYNRKWKVVHDSERTTVGMGGPPARHRRQTVLNAFRDFFTARCQAARRIEGRLLIDNTLRYLGTICVKRTPGPEDEHD